jgi:glycosyltransferase 2 family protein
MKKTNPIILLAIGIGILIVMILFIGPGKIESAIKQANPWYVALAIVLQFAVYGLWTLRWSINVKSVGISVKKQHLFPILMVGLAINNLTPSARGGGEPIRGYILSKYSNSPFEKAFATVIADRGLDTFPFIVLGVITIVAAVFYLNLPTYVIYTLIIAVIILVALFFIALYMSFNLEFGRKVSLWIVRIIKRFSKKDHSKMEENALKAIHGFQNSMRTMAKNRNVLLYGLPISFSIWILEILRVYVIFSAFNVDVSLLVIAEVFIISTLIGFIPLLPGGLGAVDGVMIILFSAAGVPPSISAGATIVERLISFWMTSIIGIASLPYFGTGVVERITKKI